MNYVEKNERLLIDILGYCSVMEVSYETFLKDSKILEQKILISKYPDLFSTKVAGNGSIRNFGSKESLNGSLRLLKNPKYFSKKPEFSKKQEFARNLKIEKESYEGIKKKGVKQKTFLNVIKGKPADLYNSRFERIITSRYKNCWEMKQFDQKRQTSQSVVIYILYDSKKLVYDEITNTNKEILIEANREMSASSGTSIRKPLLELYFLAFKELVEKILSMNSVIIDIKKCDVKIYRTGFV